MKYALSILLTLSLITGITAQKGINFYKGDWEKTLEKADKEGKLIFVDAYTTWCGPCKWMNANVFSEKSVGDFYNDNFINVKLDMEAGEGILFAKAYEVIAYPTLLFINPAGDMIHKGLGGREPRDFIELGKAASDPNRQIGSLERKFLSGDRNPDMLKSYAIALADGGMDNASSVAQVYLENVTDWKTDENMSFIFDMVDWNNMDDKLFREVAENREAYGKLIGEDQVTYRLKMGPLVKAATTPNVTRKQTEAIFHQIFPDDYKQYTDEFEMNMLSRVDNEKYLKAVVNYLEKYDINDSNQLNELAWNFYERTNDKKLLKLAKTWIEKSIALDANYMNYDTLAAICFKLKDKKEAMKHAKKAIKMANASGEDPSHTEELLKQIEGL